jgi:hypothetical protein
MLTLSDALPTSSADSTHKPTTTSAPSDGNPPTLNAPSADSTLAATTASSVQEDEHNSTQKPSDKSPASESSIVPTPADALPTSSADSTHVPSTKIRAATLQEPTINAPSAESTFACIKCAERQTRSRHDTPDKSPASESTIVPAPSDAIHILAADSTDKPSTASSPSDKNPPVSLLSPTLNAPSASSTDKQIKDEPKTDDSVLPKIFHSESSSAPLLSQSPSILTTAPPADTLDARGIGSSNEIPNDQVDKPDSEPASAISPPLAASTTLPLASSQANPNVQGEKPDSEPDNDEGDDSVLPKSVKYKIGLLVIKEFHDISCAGDIHRVVYEQNTFLYSFSFSDVGLEESFNEDEIMQYIFLADKWIVMKDLNVVKVGTIEHPAKIDSIVRLRDDSVDTKLLRVKWSSNVKDVVEISSVRPMYSSENPN